MPVRAKVRVKSWARVRAKVRAQARARARVRVRVTMRARVKAMTGHAWTVACDTAAAAGASEHVAPAALEPHLPSRLHPPPLPPARRRVPGTTADAKHGCCPETICRTPPYNIIHTLKKVVP